MLPGYSGNVSFELSYVGAVGTPDRIASKVGFFEHGVHDGLRAHDLARCESSIQDGFTACLPKLGVYRETNAFQKAKNAQSFDWALMALGA